MKILQLLFRIPYPQTDGGAIAMHNMAKGFSENGADLTLLSYNTTKHHVEPDSLPKEMLNLGKWHFVEIDNRVKPLGAFLNLFTAKSYHITRFQSKRVVATLKQLLSENKYDVVHFEGLFTGIYVDVVRKYAPGTKVVLRAHNVEHLIWERMRDEASFLKKSYLNLLAKRLKKEEIGLLPKFDAIIPITSVDEKYFSSVGVKEQFVSPTGVVLKDISTVKKEPFSVYHLGSMDWLPNREAVMWFMEHVWLIVKREVPAAKFYIAGRNMPDSFYAFDKVPGVEVVGEVQDAQEFIENKMVSVIPILSGSGLRIKIIEGLAAGKAIVSTSIGAEGVAYEDGLDIDIADTPQAFATKIIQLLKAETLVEERGQNARKLAEEKYSNFALVKELLAYYESLLSK